MSDPQRGSRRDRILLVEDDPKLAEFIATELGLEGYDVAIAANGIDGLSIARDL
jgi:DNA-binding response OmpR family regulator